MRPAARSSAAEVLQRFGFVRSSTSRRRSTRRRRGCATSISISSSSPIDKLSAVEMALLEREIRRECVDADRHGAEGGSRSDPDAACARACRSFSSLRRTPRISPRRSTGSSGARGTEAQRGSSIAVYSGKGGLGTTSIAVNLAYGFADEPPERRVALADFVVRRRRRARDAEPQAGVRRRRSGRQVDRIDEELLLSVLSATARRRLGASGVRERPEIAELLDADGAASIIDQLRAHFYVVLDCEHHMSDRTLAAFDAADRIVLVTQLNVPRSRSTQRTLDCASGWATRTRRCSWS